MTDKLTAFVLSFVVTFIVIFALLSTPASAAEFKEQDHAVTTGQACSLDAFNGESVWTGNALSVTNGAESFLLPGVEDAPNIHTELDFVAQTDTVSTRVLGDSWSSLDVTVTCQPITTTTTEQPTTTTTEATTTTTEEETTTTSSTEPSTTTTTEPTTTTTEKPCVVGVECHPDTGAASTLTILFGLLSVVSGAIMLTVRKLTA